MVRGRRYCIVDMDIEIDSKFKDQGNRYIITVHITLLARRGTIRVYHISFVLSHA